MRTKLIISAASKEELAEQIGKYFYSDKPFIILDGFAYFPSKKKLEDYRAINKKGRWRFELILEK